MYSCTTCLEEHWGPHSHLCSCQGCERSEVARQWYALPVCRRIACVYTEWPLNNVLVLRRCLYPISRDVFTAVDKKLRQDEELKPLGVLVLEQAWAYYLTQAQRIKQKQLDLTGALGSCPAEISVQVAFKVSLSSSFLSYLIGPY